MICERVWGVVKRNLTVPGTVVVFALVYIVMLAVQAGDAGASWVQAIGSLVGIAIAIAVPARQWKLVLKEKSEAAMREDHQLALMGLKICVEIEEFLMELEKRNGGDRNGWHDKEYFRAKIDALYQRFNVLTQAERNAMWWNIFLDAKNMLMEIDAALRLHDVEHVIVRILIRRYLDDWRKEVQTIRDELARTEKMHSEVLYRGVWTGSAYPDS
jgi:hypothetical protein